MARILLVDDDLAVHHAVQRALGAHTLSTVESLALGREALLADCFDLLLLDIGLPDGSGLELLGRCTTPVLTGDSFVRSGELAFSRGANDYLVKPFLPIELRCRVERLLKPYAPERGLFVDEHEPIGWYQGRRIPLTRLQHRLLQALILAGGEVLSRSWLLDSVWSHADCYPGTVDTAIESLRKRLMRYTGRSWIRTSYGKGYYLDYAEN